jgi:FMN phosphatase YigB (HAD superfamily)
MFSVGTIVRAFTSQLRMSRTPTLNGLFSIGAPNEEIPILALLTFDLDDTLFPLIPVVEDANAAMVHALHQAGYTDATETSILRHTKAIRRKSKRKMTYTEMRKRAIQAELELLSKPGKAVDNDVVNKIYWAWLDERHRSAERNLFQGVIDTLKTIKEKHPYTCIAAITNGRGNPLEMNLTLAPFFDFCISGEDDHVFPESKPQKGIFKASVSAYHQRYPHKLSQVSHIWCHVGDCLVNDVWGSARNGAQAIWIEVDQGNNSIHSQLKNGVQPKWSTASPRDINNRRKLASTGMKDVSEKITRLSQLPDAIEKILEKQYVKSIFLQSRS